MTLFSVESFLLLLVFVKIIYLWVISSAWLWLCNCHVLHIPHPHTLSIMNCFHGWLRSILMVPFSSWSTYVAALASHPNLVLVDVVKLQTCHVLTHLDFNKHQLGPHMMKRCCFFFNYLWYCWLIANFELKNNSKLSTFNYMSLKTSHNIASIIKIIDTPISHTSGVLGSRLRPS